MPARLTVVQTVSERVQNDIHPTNDNKVTWWEMIAMILMKILFFIACYLDIDHALVREVIMNLPRLFHAVSFANYGMAVPILMFASHVNFVALAWLMKPPDWRGVKWKTKIKQNTNSKYGNYNWNTFLDETRCLCAFSSRCPSILVWFKDKLQNELNDLNYDLQDAKKYWSMARCLCAFSSRRLSILAWFNDKSHNKCEYKNTKNQTIGH